MRPLAVVVEGDLALGRLLAYALERCGLDVFRWADDADLERRLVGATERSHGVALLVADVDLPGGASPATLMRVRRRLPALTIVVIAPLGDGTVAHLAHQIGASQLLEKPFDLSRLSRVARAAASSIRARASEQTGDRSRSEGAT